jgi:HK97 family phage prohead protease
MFNPDEVQVRRAAVSDLDLETGIVEVRMMTYETEAELEPGLHEVFSRGAFAAAAGNPSRCKVSDQGHQRHVVIGHAIELRDDRETLTGRLKIADTTAGRDVLTLLRPGPDGEPAVLTDLSVEFKPQKRHMKVSRRADGVLVRHDKAVLVGVSPVGSGAYGDAARVLSVREAAQDMAREAALARLALLTAGPRR